MQSVVNPMCFQVSHRIKYVVIICLVLVRFSTCSNYSSQIVLDVFVSFRSVDDCRGFLSLSLSFRVVDVRLGSRSNFIEEFLQKQISFLDCNIQKGEELFEAPLTSSVFPSDTLQSKYDVFVSFRGPDVREEVPYSYAATDEGYAEVFSSSEGICEHQERPRPGMKAHSLTVPLETDLQR
ncbi:hypothetical protein VNO80_00388 [Phaseolus coccineus]|uniref:TIR domain-containing protein n=1 Tax=Phaseolus coccineus TaxID=3886 RepID=A0AAN9NYN9_PHACN